MVKSGCCGGGWHRLDQHKDYAAAAAVAKRRDESFWLSLSALSLFVPVLAWLALLWHRAVVVVPTDDPS